MKYNVCVQKRDVLMKVKSFENFEDAYAITQVLYYEIKRRIEKDLLIKIYKKFHKVALFHDYKDLDVIKETLEKEHCVEAGFVGPIGIFIDTFED